ncbi:unnamed protein product [Paramecium octaurelia]|uniref:Uncharacterized protein n=1 Tax=Paramecium octaurelia TaxID=43137 RepID=A0A8S1SUU7_PAROT|nr:unnamed protein product [Paramecium octaurelia]
MQGDIENKGVHKIIVDISLKTNISQIMKKVTFLVFQE